jgi:hypothetical protein
MKIAKWYHIVLVIFTITITFSGLLMFILWSFDNADKVEAEKYYFFETLQPGLILDSGQQKTLTDYSDKITSVDSFKVYISSFNAKGKTRDYTIYAVGSQIYSIKNKSDAIDQAPIYIFSR